MKSTKINKIWQRLFPWALFIIPVIGISASSQAIDSDSAIVLAFRYLNQDIRIDDTLKGQVRIDSLKISNISSPYFSKLINGKEVWDIIIPQMNILYPANIPIVARGNSDFRIFIEMNTGSLVRIAYNVDSIKLSKGEIEKTELSLEKKGIKYPGLSSVMPFPFLKLLPNMLFNIFKAKAFEGFLAEKKLADGTSRPFWHIVLYDYPTNKAIPPPMTSDYRNHDYKATHFTIRRDIILDAQSGKFIKATGMN